MHFTLPVQTDQLPSQPALVEARTLVDRLRLLARERTNGIGCAWIPMGTTRKVYVQVIISQKQAEMYVVGPDEPFTTAARLYGDHTGAAHRLALLMDSTQ